MKANNFANEYESLLDIDPNIFDEYHDPDQRIDTFIYDLTFCPVERFFEIEPSVLSH
jgi:hypothetical protein